MIETRRLLVIDAQVTNVPGEQFVQLRYSYPLDGSSAESLSEANVEIRDELGASVPFLEVSPGLYKPDESFVGVVGRKYQLFIQTPDDQQYQSLEEELLEPARDPLIYGQYLPLRSETSDGFDEGVQFLIDIEGLSEENHNYRFQYEEDYEIRVPYASQYEYNALTTTIDRRINPLELCYINERSRELLIATTSGQVNSTLREFPIVYVERDEPELLGTYSLSVKTYRISGAAYQYYKDLQENNESAGSFFDRQKGQLIGNIQNINNQSEPVLGYFEVAGLSESYEIFEQDSWKEEGFVSDPILVFCRNVLDTVFTADILFGRVGFDNRLIYNFADSDCILPGTTYLCETVLAPKTCSDCRTYGSSERPAFWD